MGAHMSRLMDVYFMSHLLLGISGHNLKNASACCGGPAVIRHGFKDKANRGVHFNGNTGCNFCMCFSHHNTGYWSPGNVRVTSMAL